LISKFRRVLNAVCFLLDNSPAFEFCMPTFRNILSVPSSYLPAYEDGTECFEKLAYKIQTRGNYPEESTQPVKCFIFVIKFSLAISPLKIFRRNFLSPSEEVQGLYDVDIVCKSRYFILLYTSMC